MLIFAPDFSKIRVLTSLKCLEDKVSTYTASLSLSTLKVRLMMKVDPSPGVLKIFISPHQIQKFLTIARPNPDPPKRRLMLESPCSKGVNILLIWSSVMPIPVSLIVNEI